MPVETATYISDLDATNPPSTDPTGQGDDHLRLIKSTLKATFPNVSGAANISSGELNSLRTQMLSGATSLVPTGAIMAFGGVTADPYWLRCNGGTFNYVDQPALGAFLGFSSGVCTLPNLEDTGRFLRSIQPGTSSVRDTQANQNKSHTHTGSVSSTGSISGTAASAGSHSHTITASATVNDPGHGHDLVLNGAQASTVNVGVPTGAAPFSGGNPQCTSQSLHVASNTTGITVDVSASSNSTGAHTHTVSGTASVSGAFTTAADGGSEARPEAYVVIYYIHV